MCPMTCSPPASAPAPAAALLSRIAAYARTTIQTTANIDTFGTPGPSSSTGAGDGLGKDAGAGAGGCHQRIPARAGMEKCPQSATHRAAAHPRARGDGPNMQVLACWVTGSPRRRGSCASSGSRVHRHPCRESTIGLVCLRLDVGRNRLLFCCRRRGARGPTVSAAVDRRLRCRPRASATARALDTLAVDGVDIVTRFASRSAFIFSIVSDGDASPVVAVSRALLLWSASGGGPSDEVVGSRRRRWIGPPVRRPELEVAVPLIGRALRFLPCVYGSRAGRAVQVAPGTV